MIYFLFLNNISSFQPRVKRQQDIFYFFFENVSQFLKSIVSGEIMKRKGRDLKNPKHPLHECRQIIEKINTEKNKK